MSRPCRIDPTAAKIRMAPSVGMTTRPTWAEKASRITAIQAPAKIAAQRVRAPAETLTDVAPTEPPTGWPRSTLAARLPTPWATKSALTRERVLSRLGADSLTPAPWTTTMAAIEKAPMARSTVNAPRSGSAGVGRPEGIAPTSLTWATESTPRSTTATVGSAEREERGHRAHRRSRQDDEDDERRRAARRRRQFDAARMRQDVPRLLDRRFAFGRRTEEIRDLAERDVHRHAGEEPIITECETNRV